jgi:hypothetical protein
VTMSTPRLEPAAELTGPHLYEFNHADPINHVDPDGMQAVQTTAGYAEELALQQALGLAWLQDEYEGWKFAPTATGYMGTDSHGRVMTFDDELNQTTYRSESRQWRIVANPDGSVVRQWQQFRGWFRSEKSWTETLVESDKVRKERQNTYWDAYHDQLNNDASRLSNTLALAETIHGVMDTTVRIVSGPAGTILVDVPEAITGRSATDAGAEVDWGSRVLAGAPVALTAVIKGKRLLTLAKNVVHGGSFERAVIRGIPGAKKNWKTIATMIEYKGAKIPWNSIPDVLVSKKSIIEVKNWTTIDYVSRQLLTQVTYAKKNKMSYRLIISPRTKVSAHVVDTIEGLGGRIEVFDRSSKTFTRYVRP